MRASDLLAETFSAFNSNRARSLLTVLGVVIGISAVIAMTALIGGVKMSLVGEIGMTQARVVNISCEYGNGLMLSDVNEMSESLGEYFESVTPITYGGAEVSSPKKTANGSIQGVGSHYAEISDLKFAQGKFFTQREGDTGSLVVVLDENGVKTLFGASDTNVIGQTVRIAGAEYEIVGVLKSDGGSLGEETVEVIMPFVSCAQRIVGNAGVLRVSAETYEDVDPQLAADAARHWVIDRYQIPENKQEDSVSVFTMQSLIDQVNTLMAAFQALMTVVASISLLVGGIGIMNMMLTNVTERIREIGLRKALGARRRDITRQFLLESVFLTLAGGVIGILFGYVGAALLSGIATSALNFSEDTAIVPSIGIDTVMLVAGICVLIGVVFGYYPARRAAKLDPVESLHYQ